MNRRATGPKCQLGMHFSNSQCLSSYSLQALTGRKVSHCPNTCGFACFDVKEACSPSNNMATKEAANVT